MILHWSAGAATGRRVPLPAGTYVAVQSVLSDATV